MGASMQFTELKQEREETSSRSCFFIFSAILIDDVKCYFAIDISLRIFINLKHLSGVRNIFKTKSA